MLITRVSTAIVLFCALILLLFSGYHLAFELFLTIFFAAASWESFRLFGNAYPFWSTLIWVSVFPAVIYLTDISRLALLLGVCVAMWLVRFAPSLKFGLPEVGSVANRLLNAMYAVAILAFFLGVYSLYRHSPLFLLSIVSIVMIADIGAYAFGITLGKHKLAPKISPSKTWEGAFGGLFSVLVFAVVVSMFPLFEDTFIVKFQVRFGWLGLFAILTLLVISSVVGDLFESRLKRRAGVKDSSKLLPGHGGVLDRIDALLPVLPLACLLDLLVK